MPERIVIATRESRLAMWQAEHVQARLVALGFDVGLLPMTTRGDQILDRTLSKVGGKGLFVKELESALEDGRANLAVHSLKDVPMDLPEGFALAAVLAREDARDAFVSNDFDSLAALPEGATVGTSSLRRVVQIAALRPDLRIEPLRGNVDTRLRKLDDGEYHAIVLAAAGLRRLALGARIRCAFTESEMVPCAGQGALGLETRADATAVRAALQSLVDRDTWLAVSAERAVSRALGGSCSMPLAAHAVWRAGAAASDAVDADAPPRLLLNAAIGHPSAPDRPLLRATMSAPVQSQADAEALGTAVAATLRDAGGAAYLLAQ